MKFRRSRTCPTRAGCHAGFPRVLRVLCGIIMVALTVVSANNGRHGEASVLDEAWMTLPGTVMREMTGTCSIVLSDGMVRTYMHYFGEAGNYIEFAESEDGRNLSRTTKTNVQGTHREGDSHFTVESPAVLLLDDGTYLLVYATQNRRGSHEKHLYIRRSADGISFGSPSLLPSSAIDVDPYAPGSPTRQGVPDLVLMPDRSIRLYYVAAALAVASMRSTDGGRTWVQDSGCRMGDISTDAEAFVDPDIIVNADGTVTMYFAYSEPRSERHCGGLGCQRIRRAVSQDGVSFTMIADDLLVGVDGRSVVDPDVYQIPDGTWYMLYGEHLTEERIDLKVAQRSDD